MTASPPDKAGLHILLKLACTVVILGYPRGGGYHCSASAGAVFAIVLNPLVTWFYAGASAAQSRLPLW